MSVSASEASEIRHMSVSACLASPNGLKEVRKRKSHMGFVGER